MSTHIAIVYHSGFGHTERLAKAVQHGAAAVNDAECSLISVTDIDKHWDHLLGCQGILFGCPTYMGSASAPFKTFMDASSKVWFTLAWKDKVAGGFTNSASQSGDKLSTLTQLAVFAAQHGMIWVGTGMLPGNNSSKGSVDDMNRLGSSLGAMAQSNADQGPDVAPPAADLKTATAYGQRFAEACVRWEKGKGL